MKISFYLLPVIFFILLSCDKDDSVLSEVHLKTNSCYSEQDPPRNTAKVSIEQGIWGDIWLWKGDFMPTIGRGIICQVKRTVYIYELTTMDDVDQIDFSPLFSNIYTDLITTVESDAEGFFQVSLEPGTYSLFIMEGDNFYSNRGSNDGEIIEIFPVSVSTGEVPDVRIDITTEAVF